MVNARHAPKHHGEMLGDNHTAIEFLDHTAVKELNETTTATTVKYLGTLMNTSSNNSNDVRARLGRAKQDYDKLHNIWNSDLTFKQKFRVSQAIFLPMITYSLPQSVNSQTILKQIDSWYAGRRR